MCCEAKAYKDAPKAIKTRVGAVDPSFDGVVLVGPGVQRRSKALKTRLPRRASQLTLPDLWGGGAMAAHFSLGGDSFLSITVRKCSTFTLKVAKPSTPHSPPRLWGYVVAALPRAFHYLRLTRCLSRHFSGLVTTFRVLLFTRSVTHRTLRFRRSLLCRRLVAKPPTDSLPESVLDTRFLGGYRTPPVPNLDRNGLSIADFRDPKRVKRFSYSIRTQLYGVCRHFSPTVHFIHLLAPFLGACTASLPVASPACANSCPDYSVRLPTCDRCCQKQLYVCRCSRGYTVSRVPSIQSILVFVFLTLRTHSE